MSSFDLACFWINLSTVCLKRFPASAVKGGKHRASIIDQKIHCGACLEGDDVPLPIPQKQQAMRKKVNEPSHRGWLRNLSTTSAIGSQVQNSVEVFSLLVTKRR